MSDSNYQVIGDVVFYQPLHNQSYYFVSSGRHIGYLTEEILNNINLIVNFDDYDNNNDGKVDMIQICFRFANTYELDYRAYDDTTDNIKPKYQGIAGLAGFHRSFVNGTTLTLDGKTINAAWLTGSGTFCSGVIGLDDGLEVMAHELGHYLFGGVHYVGVGFHGLMDGNGSGAMSSFERIKMGWITPTLVTANKTNEVITDALATNDIYKIVAPNGSYFLIDNHQRQNFYESSWKQWNGGPLVSPGTGLIISHCTSLSSNVDIESAFGRWDWKKSGNLYVFPFETDVPDRNFGEDKLDLRNKNTTAGKKNHPDFLGSAEDFFNMSYKHVFSPWSNPSTSYNSNNNSSISIVLRQNISGIIYADFYVDDIIITENTSFPTENFEFSGNVIVSAGVTLTLQPNTTLKFASGKSLIVNGILNVQGTSSNKVTFDFIAPDASTQNGIKINNGGNADISYAIIKNAYNGISITTPISGSPSIQNSEIENCTNGIKVQYGNKDADITIANNNIHDIDNYGISIANPGHYGMNVEPSTSNNTITRCYRGIYLNEVNVDLNNGEISDCTYGLYLYRTNYAGQPTITNVHSHDNGTAGIALYYSSPRILDSEFDGNHYGIKCSNYSSAELGYAGTYGNNYIHNNFYGLFAYSNSNPFLGRETCTIQGGHNKTENSTLRHISAQSYCTVIAEENWWGSNPPQLSIFYDDGTSSIDYTPWLVSSPFKMVPSRSKSPEEYVFNNAFENPTSVDTTKPNSGTPRDEVTGFDPSWKIFWKLLYARNLIDVKKYKFAQEICKNIINEHPDSALSFYALDLLWKASQTDDEDLFKSYLSGIKSKKVTKDLYGSAELILAGYENGTRISSMDNLANRYSNKNIGEAALFSKFLYYFNEAKNLEMARAASDELDDRFPNSPAAIDAHMQLGDKIKNMVISKSGNVEKLLSSDEMPKEYSLLGNYPNPFNPSTKIRYALQFNSDVEITIYNINGQVVKTFKYGSQSAGLYDVRWNGTNSNNQHVSSGIYLYHFRAVSLEKNNEVFEKSAKLILMK